MEKVKKYCFIFLVLLLFLPIAQRFFKLHTITPLHGTSPFSEYPTFHFKDWHSGCYQQLVELFVKDNFGFRNTLLRYTNSLDFELFKTVNALNVVVGKDDYLFFCYNIESYLGITRQDTHTVDSLFVLTDSLRNTLKKRDIDLVFVVVPSNAFYYSDKFPHQYDNYPKKENDYDYYLKKFTQYKINYVDFNKWFTEIKDTVTIDLFPKNGTHYTYFSAVWVGDSLVKYMEKLRGIDMPDIDMTDVKLDTMKSYEPDLASLLNIGHDLVNEKLYYYKLKFDSENKSKPKVLAIGDSFYWPIMNQLIPENCFENVAYWFYNNTVYPESFTKTITTDQVDLDSLFNGLDVIMIFSSATLMHNYDYNGFIGDMFNYLSGNYTLKKDDERLQFWIDAIKNNENWYNTIKTKANDLNVPVDVQVRDDATWMLKQEKANKL
jgi:hypothetical protein